MPFALQVITDDPGQWRWVLIEEADDALSFKEHSAADCDFETYQDALNAGTIALAYADGQPYENEAADPVGDSDCA